MRLVQRIGRSARLSSAPEPDVAALARTNATALSRRAFVQRGLAVSAATVLPVSAFAAPRRQSTSPRVVIVGAGLAGLAAAYTLRKAGLSADVFEGSPRAGGRCWSERRIFDQDQIAERGGELIDTEHREIRLLAAELGLELDDLLAGELPGSQAIFMFGDGRYTLEDATSDFQSVLPALDADVGSLGGKVPTFRRFTPAQRALDRMSATTWIATRVPGGLASRLGQLLGNAYIEELGGDLYETSAIGLVVLLNGSPRDRLSPYEESDQRYHIRGGNDQLVHAMAQRLDDRLVSSQRLLAMQRNSDGRYRLTFSRDQATRDELADRVILALPFTLLRQVDLSRAALRPRKEKAIRELGMGRNTKLQLQFKQRYWQQRMADGETRLAGCYQTTWDVTRAQSGAAGILNFFSGGSTATRAGEGETDDRARDALTDLERAMPGISAQWNGKAIRNAWDRNPWTLGSYALFKPGQYTTLNGILDEREGAVHFAGEQTSQDWAGFMNGAVESGQRAAREVLLALRMSNAAPSHRATAA
jgi:monoamine oxidase